MARAPGLDPHQEFNPAVFVRDTRPISTVVIDFLTQPGVVGFALIMLVALMLVAPAFSDLAFVLGALWFWMFKRRKPSLPLKLPAQVPLPDPNNPHPGTGRPGKAEGIFFLGNDQRDSSELWITNSDARTHFLVLGTTGAGKTESLLSMSANALSWGSGLLYTDGKGDSALWGKVYSLARRFGRDDDLLLLNFMTGNTDAGGSSNTTNPFYAGAAANMTEMLVSLMDDAGADGDMWKGRAISMVGALMIALCELRDKGKILLNVNAIRDHMSLPKLIDLYFDPNRQHELSRRSKEALKGYLDSLPGFDWAEAEAGRPQPATTNDQHGYLYMQFTRIMGSLAETYGYIFGGELGDVDFYDLVVNRRILVVLLPALEKSEAELANLGKIVVAALKGMMATTLGAKVEGDWGDVIDTKPTNSPSPFVAILDEVGYYTVPGMAAMAAQARSLGFALIFAAQDLAAMKKRSAQEADSIIANTNVKAFMKLEDLNETKELFSKAMGKTNVTMTSGFTQDPTKTFSGYGDTNQASISRVDREEFMNVRGLGPGQAYIVQSGKVLRTTMFFANPKSAPRLRYNRFLIVRAPDQMLIGAGTVDQVIRNLSDERFTVADAEPVKPTVGEIAVAARIMAGARKVRPQVRACAAVAAVNRALSGVDVYSPFDQVSNRQAEPTETPAASPSDTASPPATPAPGQRSSATAAASQPTGRRSSSAPASTGGPAHGSAPAKANGAVANGAAANGDQAANGAAANGGQAPAPSSQPAEVGDAPDDIFARIWGGLREDVVGNLRDIQRSVANQTGRDEVAAIEAVAHAATDVLDYPGGPAPPRQLDEAILGALLYLQDALTSPQAAGTSSAASGATAAGSAAAAKDEGDEDFDWDIDADWSIEGDWSADAR